MSLKDFEVLGKIGEGSFSSVFKVLRRSDQTIYALKKVVMRKLKQKEKNNALNEIRILASIDHPNIISYKQAFFDEESESLCIVMDFADAGDLLLKITEHKKKGTFMSENFLWHVLIKLTRALKVLHEMRIMHRDLKSANVFLGKDGKVKLGDLNVSKVIKDSLNHTQTGTPYYASPEVWKDEPYDFKSDIWSLGCVIYEAAALKPPFQAEDMKSLYKKVIKGNFSPLSEFSEDFNEIVKLLLTLDPKQRPSASEILKNDLIHKRVNLKEELEASQSALLKTIRIGQSISGIRDKLPEAKYSFSAAQAQKRGELPSIHRIQRGQTFKCMEDLPGKKDETLVYKKIVEKAKVEKKYSVKSILRENYGALKLPRVKYPPIAGGYEGVRDEGMRGLYERPIYRKIF
jgi:NIMA (never in mitosis gene a)-related kinase